MIFPPPPSISPCLFQVFLPLHFFFNEDVLPYLSIRGIGFSLPLALLKEALPLTAPLLFR